MKIIIVFLGMIIFSNCNQALKVEGRVKSRTNNSSAVQTTSGNTFVKKTRPAIDFTASGTEPFWSIEIDFDYSMHFKTLDGYEIITPAVAGVKETDANVTRYAASTERGLLTVQIQKLECINDMSGNKSAYTVKIDTKYHIEKENRAYKGCGTYFFDYRMHDIWLLDSINDKKVSAAAITKGPPLLEINLTENKFFGHSGCNSINGPLEVFGKQIYFGKLVSTRVACNNINFETLYQQALNDKMIPYQIKPGKLYLQVNSDSLFIYKKVD